MVLPERRASFENNHPDNSAAAGTASAPSTAARRFDVVIYGGTPAGIVMAVAAAREGLKVALLEPRRHLGGMVTGGLGQTDKSRTPEVIGGYSLEFFERVGRAYGEPGIKWHFEPHVAARIFDEMVKEAGVTVFFNHRLREKTGVAKRGSRISEIRMENGATFAAAVFTDATYEGDLMAQAKVSYTWGRARMQLAAYVPGLRASGP